MKERSSKGTMHTPYLVGEHKLNLDRWINSSLEKTFRLTRDKCESIVSVHISRNPQMSHFGYHRHRAMTEGSSGRRYLRNLFIWVGIEAGPRALSWRWPHGLQQVWVSPRSICLQMINFSWGKCSKPVVGAPVSFICAGVPSVVILRGLDRAIWLYN